MDLNDGWTKLKKKKNHRSNPSNSIFVGWIQMARGQSPGTCMFLPYNLINKFWPIPILLSLETILFGFVWKSATRFHPLLGVFHYKIAVYVDIILYPTYRHTQTSRLVYNCIFQAFPITYIHQFSGSYLLTLMAKSSKTACFPSTLISALQLQQQEIGTADTDVKPYEWGMRINLLFWDEQKGTLRGCDPYSHGTSYNTYKYWNKPICGLCIIP